MSSKKSVTNPAVIVCAFFAVCVLALFIYWLTPEQNPKTLKEVPKITDEELAIQEQNASYDEMMQRFSKAKAEAKLKEKGGAAAKESEAKAVEESSTIEEVSANQEKRRLEVVYEDEFVKEVILPNGRVTPVLKSYRSLGESEEEIEARFKFEKRDEEWAGNWENTLNNIVGSAGAQFDMGGYDVTCKSKTCKISVKLSEDNPYGYNEAFMALNKEFVLNDMQVAPGPIKEEGTGYIVHYYFPDGR